MVFCYFYLIQTGLSYYIFLVFLYSAGQTICSGQPFQTRPAIFLYSLPIQSLQGTPLHTALLQQILILKILLKINCPSTPHLNNIFQGTSKNWLESRADKIHSAGKGDGDQPWFGPPSLWLPLPGGDQVPRLPGRPEAGAPLHGGGVTLRKGGVSPPAGGGGE